MTQLLYAYCLISLGVKITCSNQTNSKSVVVATQGSTSYKDNIACIFGFKQLQTLLEIKPEYVTNIKENIFHGLSCEVEGNEESIKESVIDDVEIDLSEDSNDAENTEVKSSQSSMSSSQKSQGYKNLVNPVEIIGFISSCAHGNGRSSTDRQFYYINSRPCEPIKIIKLINEIYRQYNSNQYPFVFLNVNLNRNFVDVNVTPDKRKIFLTKEKIIIDALKHSLLKLFENIPKTLKVEQFNNTYNKDVIDNMKPEVDQPRIFNSFIQRFANNVSDSDKSEAKDKIKSLELKRKSTTLLNYVSLKTKKLANINNESDEQSEKSTTNIIKSENLEENVQHNNEHIENKKSKNTNDFSNTTLDENLEKCNSDQDINILGVEDTKEIMYLEFANNLPNTQIRNISDVIDEKSSTSNYKKRKSLLKPELSHSETIKESETIITDKGDLGKHIRRSVNMKVSLDHIKVLTELYKNQNIKTAPERVKFKSVINPVFNKKCEEELSKEISKDNFNQMIVVGQFNLGFIITQLENDLFIIDQHATDEIYNFETLQKTTELANQKLVIPQQLELTGVNEQILMDNLDIFKKNGFTFAINPEAPPTKRVKLLTLPMSKNWIFGKEDIEELLFMLRESPSEYCRSSRVRAMFASRACRKSVMIGTALNKIDMKKLVEHMAEIDKPWNCPHGRPTIRHLVNLSMIYTQDK